VRFEEYRIAPPGTRRRFHALVNVLRSREQILKKTHTDQRGTSVTHPSIRPRIERSRVSASNAMEAHSRSPVERPHGN
jgi:hypothetical protein